MKSVQLIAEVGINHNGSLQNALNMISLAKEVGFDRVKFQKRTPDLCVPEDKKNKEKRVPWKDEPITYLQYKKDIEFNYEYKTINTHCNDIGIQWFVSVWDIDAAKYMLRFNNDFVKIPSAMLTNTKLLQFCRDNFQTIMLSTGMSTQKEIDQAVDIGKPDILMHTNSVYPTPIENTNLGYLQYLKDLFPSLSIGYSNHCADPSALFAAAVLYPIEWVEVHVTLDVTRWGSDQKSSFEFSKLQDIVQYVKVLSDNKRIWKEGNAPRILYKNEDVKQKSLRG